MPLYDLCCPLCGKINEVAMGVDDQEVVYNCESCDAEITRCANQYYANKRIAISGDTCANSVDYSGWDDGLDTYVRSRDHRKQIMAERGLTEYVPDPTMKKARDEARYIRDHAPKGDKAALHAARQQSRDADKKRKERTIKAAFQKARKDLVT